MKMKNSQYVTTWGKVIVTSFMVIVTAEVEMGLSA
jgi:hypothetical protein